MNVAHDPVPAHVRAELGRLRTRWTQLPYERACGATAALVVAVTELSERDARLRGRLEHLRALVSGAGVHVDVYGERVHAPEPAQAMDMLAAVVFDVFAGLPHQQASSAAHTPEDASSDHARAAHALADEVHAVLVSIRRGLPDGIASPAAHPAEQSD